MLSASEIIRLLNLEPLPGEGGYYRQSFKDSSTEDFSFPEHKGREERANSTAIYFLITANEFSALHRLPQAELYHFYLGDPVEMLQLNGNGELQTFTLGSKIDRGELLQLPVPPKVWQGTRLKSGGQWALLGATLSPGFEFKDLELANRNELTKLYPQHAEEITRFTR